MSSDGAEGLEQKLEEIVRDAEKMLDGPETSGYGMEEHGRDFEVIESPETVNLLVEVPLMGAEDLSAFVSGKKVELIGRNLALSVPLPCEIEPSSAAVSVRNGIFSVVLRKLEPVGPGRL
ncbi:MAG: Hsp20/alpha crystallin family protein [archaeon]|nr:MAG: Hsp20/alpha crystallin family protein [archaeon]